MHAKQNSELALQHKHCRVQECVGKIKMSLKSVDESGGMH